jgi:hypothetical protein
LARGEVWLILPFFFSANGQSLAECGGWEFFGILDDLRQDLEALLGRRVDVVSIRGPAPDARDMAAEIERDALPL